MSEKQTSNCKRAFKLYNKRGATDNDKVQAMVLLKQENPRDLDEYGIFLKAEITFWKRQSSLQERIDAFDTFRKMSCEQNLPLPLIVGACFFAGRCYELGFATEHNFEAALICYRKANKINPNACVKDIERLEKAIDAADKKPKTAATPDRFSYKDGVEGTGEIEYRNAIDEWAKDFEQCLTSLRDNRFFYGDDPDEINVDEIEIYNVADEDD